MHEDLARRHTGQRGERGRDWSEGREGEGLVRGEGGERDWSEGREGEGLVRGERGGGSGQRGERAGQDSGEVEGRGKGRVD